MTRQPSRESRRRPLARGVELALGAPAGPGGALSHRHRRVARAQPLLQRLPGSGRARPLRDRPGRRAPVATPMAERLWGVVRPPRVLAAGHARAYPSVARWWPCGSSSAPSPGARARSPTCCSATACTPALRTRWRSRFSWRSRRSSSASRSTSSPTTRPGSSSSSAWSVRSPTCSGLALARLAGFAACLAAATLMRQVTVVAARTRPGGAAERAPAAPPSGSPASACSSSPSSLSRPCWSTGVARCRLRPAAPQRRLRSRPHSGRAIFC